MTTIQSITDRDKIISDLKRELLGPSPNGQPIDCTNEIIFQHQEDSWGPWVQEGSSEEILQRERPISRYGAGILFPADASARRDSHGVASDDDSLDDLLEAAGDESKQEEPGWVELENNLAKTKGRRGLEDESDQLDISGVNAFRQNSMGLSFLAEIQPESILSVKVTAGRYTNRRVQIVGSKDKDWWLRSPVTLEAKFSADQLHSSGRSRLRPIEIETNNCDDLDIAIEAYSRPYHLNGITGQTDLGLRMITVCVVNRSAITHALDSSCLFQTWFEATVDTDGTTPHIHPYPSRDRNTDSDDPEVESLALLYRGYGTFAVGHGCAADWVKSDNQPLANSLRAEALPECEVPSITPDIFKDGPDGDKIEISMSALAGLVNDDDGISSLSEVIDLYRGWIVKQQQRTDIPDPLSGAANRHINSCLAALTRMESGLEYLRSNEEAKNAFQLANRAVLLQQISSSTKKRLYKYDNKEKRYYFPEPYIGPDCKNVPDSRGTWRPFQIAFLLTSLKSTAEPIDSDRETVELLWFPTGGGKTEAYLGLTAFSIFLRRLKDPHDTGVQVLMRYTLRLLTSQQFQRASSLICAMEMVRQADPSNLGETPFSVGLWLGGDTTPNRKSDAKRTFDALARGGSARGSFSALECPWCRAQIGPHKEGPRSSSKIAGYKQKGQDIIIACSDTECPFYNNLPLYVVDDDIYEKRPDLVIGTIDKFATLTWRPEARRLFGISLDDGSQEHSPPALIIQDELHLISGPLGSMAGLYEGLIEELCTDRREDPPLRPKIISSTATIRRSEQQIKDLYGRGKSALFPPPGIDVSDSFFSSFARSSTGELLPGKKFVGVYTANLPSMQTTQVRTFAALLQSPGELPDANKDPWWTLMAFFNSLRELGNTLSLMQHDIITYLRAINRRAGKQQLRYLNNWIELTGRLRDEEISPTLDRLDVSWGSTDNRPLDACLASNIIEVGIDIDRLSLMVVVGQPKTTSQYIQVTGRVGRQWQTTPGLVVSIYGVGRPRDRSHFEKFRSYHERLYASVEPTSVTPFAPPVLERALHACLVGYAKQYGGKAVQDSPYPFPEELVEQFKAIMADRVKTVDPNEEDGYEEAMEKCIRHWQDAERTSWGTPGRIPEANDLMAAQGSFIPPNLRWGVWPTPTSLRNVDAECEMQITQLYLREDQDA